MCKFIVYMKLSVLMWHNDFFLWRGKMAIMMVILLPPMLVLRALYMGLVERSMVGI